MVGDERDKVWCGVGHVTPRDPQPLGACGQDKWRMGPRAVVRAERPAERFVRRAFYKRFPFLKLSPGGKAPHLNIFQFFCFYNEIIIIRRKGSHSTSRHDPLALLF